MNVSGRCYCGYISFEVDIQPDKVRVCHCTDCQTLSGSAFRTNVPVVQGTFVLKKGEPKTFFKSADTGNRIVHAFCPNCGTPIYSAVPGEPPGYSLRVGTLHRRTELVPSRQILLALGAALDPRSKSAWDGAAGPAIGGLVLARK